MQTGFQKIGKSMYYFGKDGKMKTGLQIIKKKKYYFNRKDVGVKTINKFAPIPIVP